MLRSSALLVCAALLLAACDSSVQAPATEQDERVLDRSSLPSLESYFEYSATAGKNEKYACAVAIRLKNGKILTRVKPMALPKEFASVGGTRKVLYALRDQNGAVLRIAECAIPDSDLVQSWLVESALRLPAELRSANSTAASKAAATGLICSWDPVFNGYVCEDQIIVTPGNEGDLLGDPDMPDSYDWPYYELPPSGGGGAGSTGGGSAPPPPAGLDNDEVFGPKPDCEEEFNTADEDELKAWIWCNAGQPSSSDLAQIQVVVNYLIEKGGICASLGATAQQLIADGGLRFYDHESNWPGGFAALGGDWAGLTREMLHYGFVVHQDLQVNAASFVAHEMDHIQGRNHLNFGTATENKWHTPNSMLCL